VPVSVTHQSQSATWLVRQGKHRVRLTEIQLYIFCNSYNQDNMRQNKASAFELYFMSEEAARRFKEVFYPANSPISSDTSDPPAGPSK